MMQQQCVSRRLRCSWQRPCRLALVGMAAVLVVVGLTSQRARREEGTPLPTPSERAKFHVAREALVDPGPTALVDLRHFRFLVNNESACADGDVYVLAFVHSSPADFDARNAVRSTWGGVGQVSGHRIRTVFLLGTTSKATQERVDEESRAHGDIVQGDFVDAYRNLTYKHVMGLKWVTRYCNGTRFVLKADQDVFADVFQLADYLVALYGDATQPPPPRTLLCNVYPHGTPALRHGKWAVDHATYAHDHYPPYCAGLAYLVTPDVARDLNAASAHVPFFWIDDVYVTGFLTEALRLRHLSLNLRLTTRLAPTKAWLRSNSTLPPPYLLADIGDDPAWPRLLAVLWDKTLTVHDKRTRKHPTTHASTSRRIS